jgi:hypothetical protein
MTANGHFGEGRGGIGVLLHTILAFIRKKIHPFA